MSDPRTARYGRIHVYFDRYDTLLKKVSPDDDQATMFSTSTKSLAAPLDIAYNGDLFFVGTYVDWRMEFRENRKQLRCCYQGRPPWRAG